MIRYYTVNTLPWDDYIMVDYQRRKAKIITSRQRPG